MRWYKRSLKIPAMSNKDKNMEHELLPQKSEHSINNVNYQITASFQDADDKNSGEDFVDKIKRLILSEDIAPHDSKK